MNGGALWVVVMNLLLLLPLALTFACLALLSFVAFLGVAAIGGALRVIGAVTSVLGIAGQKEDDPWRSAVGDAHPLDYVRPAIADTVCGRSRSVAASGAPSTTDPALFTAAVANHRLLHQKHAAGPWMAPPVSDDHQRAAVPWRTCTIAPWEISIVQVLQAEWADYRAAGSTAQITGAITSRSTSAAVRPGEKPSRPMNLHRSS
jgi:hypothetical protein